MATIRDVARLAGVSISTVSLTLNAPDRVSPETRARVDAAAAEVGYVANPIAQSLKRGQSRLIGMVVGDIVNPFFGDLLRQVEGHAAERGYMVIVSDTDGRPEAERAILGHLRQQRVAGVLLTTCLPFVAPHDHLSGMTAPLVLFDHRLQGLDCDYVGSDNPLASAMLTEHLIRLGHRRIGYIGGTTGVYTAEERRRGFEATMRAHGLEPEPALMLDGRYDGRGGYEGAMRLLTEQRPTALLVASNVMALGALQAANELGLRCPQDVSLAGIDDVPWSAVIRPRITMAVQPVHDMGRTACELLIERIEGGPLPVRQRIFAPRLVIGGSTCPPLG